MKPVIGIVFCAFSDNRQFVTHSYVEAIEKSGGFPIIIPYVSSINYFAYYLSICNGLMFCGGNDLTPLLFEEELLTTHGKTDWNTDFFHLEFMKCALGAKLPILAICRGMQIMNVALGGTIFQDISLRSKPSINHMQLSDNRSDPCHKIIISKSSILYNIFSDSATVNSFHHQCIHVLGKEIRIVSVASDGVIEAIEIPNHPFALGVQWHPECMYQTNPGMKEIFLTFIRESEASKKLLLL